LSAVSSKLSADEALLIGRARSGDERAFTELVTRYEGPVYNFAFKVCRDREKAGETLQDTFLTVFRKLSQFDSRSAFTTWLYRIVANHCKMKHRRRKLDTLMESFDEPPIKHDHRDDERERDFPAPEEDTPMEKLLTKELQRVLDKSIQKLPLDYRTVFVLRDVEGLSTKETAGVVKISEEAVKSRLRRARAFLRREIAPYMGWQPV
jgi:RNA polymerase sigma-70 factor (ECF subfamily)